MRNIPKNAYAIIIGAMRCGTTSLFNYLAGHPEICPAINKEPEYFSENQGHKVQVNHYNELWPHYNSNHKYVLEASTGYTKYPKEPNVPENILNYGIEPKFIYIIRNPFDRITSHYNYMQNFESWDLAIDNIHLINTSDYFKQLEQYRKYFPMQNILLLDFDDLRDNPKNILDTTYNFLQLSCDYFPEKFEIKNITRSTSPAKRTLTTTEKDTIYNKLTESMYKLFHTYGFDVRKWGFDI